MSQYLSIQEAADALQVDYKVVYRLVKEGRIPSARVGWQFRITQSDLNAYLNAEKVKQAASARELNTSAGMAAESQAPINGQHASAVLSLDTTFKDMRIQGSGEDGISKLRARQLEQSFIARFDEKVTSVTMILHPTNGKLHQIEEWEALREEDENLEAVMVALKTAYLDRQTLATTPHNTCVRYIVNASPKLVIEARVIAHLATLCTMGYDEVPTSRKEIVDVLDELARQSKAQQSVVIVGLASPTGWETDAVAEVHRARSDSHHRGGIHVVLVDLRAETISFNHEDDVAARFAGLFEMKTETEDLATLRERLRAEVDDKSGVILRDFAQTLGVHQDVVTEVAKGLVDSASATYRLVPDRAGHILVKA